MNDRVAGYPAMLDRGLTRTWTIMNVTLTNPRSHTVDVFFEGPTYKASNVVGHGGQSVQDDNTRVYPTGGIISPAPFTGPGLSRPLSCSLRTTSPWLRRTARGSCRSQCHLHQRPALRRYRGPREPEQYELCHRRRRDRLVKAVNAWNYSAVSARSPSWQSLTGRKHRRAELCEFWADAPTAVLPPAASL